MKFILALLGFGALLASGARVQQQFPFQGGVGPIPKEQIEAILAQIGDQAEDVQQFITEQIQKLVAADKKFRGCLEQNQCGPLDLECAFENCAPPELKQLAGQLIEQVEGAQEALQGLNEDIIEEMNEFFGGDDEDDEEDEEEETGAADAVSE